MTMIENLKTTLVKLFGSFFFLFPTDFASLNINGIFDGHRKELTEFENSGKREAKIHLL